jgi:hypothetical protein
LEERLHVALQLERSKTEALFSAANLSQSVSVIAASGPVATFTSVETPPAEILPPSEGRLPPSESTNAWPDEAAEAAFLGETRAPAETPVPPPAEVPAARAEEFAGKKLPKLDDLVHRIPEGTRELLEELFRAKFVAVRRVPGKALKAN